jgi:hypothetical protein
MKQVRLLLSSLVLAASVGASASWACDKDHNSSAAAAGATSKSHTAATCSAEMRAAYLSKGAANAAVHCPGMLGVAVNVSAAAPAANADCCAAKSAATAVTADNASDHCSGKSAKAVTALNTDKSRRAVLAGAGGQCSGHSATNTSARLMHGDCDACADMADCESELSTAGTRVQMVPLKNGVMFVYTASSPGRVSALQSSLARRSERLNQIISSGEKARLCAECKAMRGAMASGKLNREVVNIEGGALTLMTSSDPAMVSKIYSLLDVNSKLARKS